MFATFKAVLAMPVLVVAFVWSQVFLTITAAQFLATDYGRRLATQQDGQANPPLMALIGGVLFLVLGLVLSSTILSQAATSGSSANIGSFSGAQNVNDLIPLLYYFGLAVGSMTLIGLGGAGLAGKGPMRTR